MPAPKAPTDYVLGNWELMPSTEYEGCIKLSIRPQVMDPKDHNKVGWKLERERWFTEERKFKKVGTSEATITVEDGWLIVANNEGEKASLRLPKSIHPTAPIVHIDPNDLVVILQKASAAAASG